MSIEIRKAEYLEYMIKAFNEYQDSDTEPEAKVEGSKLTEILDDNIDDFDEDEAESIKYIAQGLLAAVAEGLAKHDAANQPDEE